MCILHNTQVLRYCSFLTVTRTSQHRSANGHVSVFGVSAGDVSGLRPRLTRKPVAPHQDKGITELLMAPGELASEIEGMSGTRNLSDNLSDLKAQARRSVAGMRTHLLGSDPLRSCKKRQW